MHDGFQTDILIMDFSKAFDKVSHIRLIPKLRSYGISGKTIQWIHSFLSERKQNVVLEGISSDDADVPSAVPQGSVLGLSLFSFLHQRLAQFPSLQHSIIRR